MTKWEILLADTELTAANKFIYYRDPGHGWLAVPLNILNDLGIADKISSFSYMKGNTAYLEEDQDMDTFIDAWKAAGNTFEYENKITKRNSPIRSYPRYVNTFKEESSDLFSAMAELFETKYFSRILDDHPAKKAVAKVIEVIRNATSLNAILNSSEVKELGQYRDTIKKAIKDCYDLLQ